MGWFGPSGSCGCCARCEGPCTDITYTSMDIELVGDMAGYTGITYVINSKLIDLLEYRSPLDWETVQPAVDPYLACSWYSGEINDTYTGYGRNDLYEYFVTIGGKKNDPSGPNNRIRVHIAINAFGPAFPLNQALGGSWRFSKEMFIDDCDELLTPIDLNYQSGGPIAAGVSPYHISGVKWNLNL